MRKILGITAIATLLTGCVVTTPPTATTPGMTVVQLPAALASFTLADLKAADDDAKAHGDTVASMCYEAVIPLIQTASAPSAPAGLVSGFQSIRDGVSATSGAQALLKELEIPCGPLAADVNLTLLQLLGKFATAAVPHP